MANRNTNPGIGKNADPGVVHNPQPSRARTRGMSYGDINIARTALFDKINRLIREIIILFGVSPQLFFTLHKSHQAPVCSCVSSARPPPYPITQVLHILIDYVHSL